MENNTEKQTQTQEEQSQELSCDRYIENGMGMKDKERKCQLIVRYYRYPQMEMGWRRINATTTLHDACHVMYGCLRGLSGSPDYYCEAVVFINGRKMPGLSNKREHGFDDGRIHWKCL